MLNNSIPKFELKSINTFGQVANRKPSDYWLPTQTSNENPDKYVSSEDINESNETSLKALIITPSEARKTKNIKTIGLSIAGATVITTATLFFLLKGGPKGLSKNFQRMKDFLARKIQSTKLETDEIKSFADKVYLFAYKCVDAGMKRVEAINNFTSFKDVVFKKMMYLTKPLENVHNGITKMFERIGRQSVLDSYDKTGKNLKIALSKAEIVTSNARKHNPSEIVEINGKKLTRAQWFDKAKELETELQEQFLENFAGESLKGRYHRIKKTVEIVKTSFDKLGKFFSKDIYRNFMAEVLLVDPKRALQADVISKRRAMTFSRKDLWKDADDRIMRITGMLSFNDAEQIYRLRQIRVMLNDFTKVTKQPPKLRNDILAQIKLLENLLKENPSKFGTEQNYNKLMFEIIDLKGLVEGYKPGNLQELGKIYKYLLPKKEYKAISGAYQEYISSLDKSIRLETEEFPSKLRDLALGSAPTDILSILGGLGVLGYQLGKSENNEQRTSISLKYGIPALAGIGVSLYCNAKLFAGTKSLIIGTISSLALNKLGVLADDGLKEYLKNKKKSASSTKSV